MILILFASVGARSAWGIVDPPLTDTNGVTGGYQLTDLVTDSQAAVTSAGLPAAAHTDTNLVNPWGMAAGTSTPMWISNNGMGNATLYDGNGNPQALIVTVPASTNAGATSPAPVTGDVFNGTTDFNVGGVGGAHFIFATEDGTIAGWNSGTTAVMKVDNANFTTGPVYKGLAIGSSGGSNFIYATNFRTGKVDVFNGTFNKQTTGFSFTDPTLPVGYAPFGIANIGGLLYVTYAVQDAAKHDDVAAVGNGIVSVFDTAGTFVHRVATNGTLDSPWGIAKAPAGFGPFSNDLLVGNFGNGRINAFDPSTFAFEGQLLDGQDNFISIPGLWGLRFGAGGTNGSRGALFFTAGIGGEAHGLFGRIAPAPTGPDFPATEGSAFSRVVSSFTDGDPSGTASQFSAVIDWGDGTSSSASVIADPVRTGVFDVNGSHTYAEEGFETVTTTITDSAGAKLITTMRAVVSDASLVPGHPVTATAISGVGGNNTSTTPGTANAALNAFKAAIGGVDNGATPPEKTSGLRSINWDGVALDGTDFGGDSTVIDNGHVVNVPTDRWQERGLTLDRNIAVSGPLSLTDTSTFADVNASVDNVLHPFSPTKAFAPFNANVATLAFVTPSTHGTTTPVQQTTRGFGAVFANVRLPNSTSIEYFDGATSLGTFYAPVGTAGQAEFIGELFDRSVVTSVKITFGSGTIFDFDGSTFSADSTEAPESGVNLVAADDLVYAEPAPPSTTVVRTNARGKINSIVAQFADADPNGSTGDYAATIDWGDGHRSAGTIVTDTAGGFDVEGAHAYRRAGRRSGVAHVVDFGGATVDLPFVVRVRR